LGEEKKFIWEDNRGNKKAMKREDQVRNIPLESSATASRYQKEKYLLSKKGGEGEKEVRISCIV